MHASLCGRPLSRLPFVEAGVPLLLCLASGAQAQPADPGRGAAGALVRMAAPGGEDPAQRGL